MKTFVVSSMALLVAVSVGGAAGPPPKRHAKAELEAMVRKLSFFQTGEMIYDSHYHQMPSEVHAAYEKVVRPLFLRAYPVSSLLPLLKHPNPRVRTLAAAGLYAYENPRLLLELVPLLEDRAETFPAVSAPGNFSLGNFGGMPPMEVQRVADVARRFLDVYLREAGYQEGIAPGNGHPGLADYWARRKGRTYCASWFAVRVLRATSKENLSAVRAIRKEIDRLPEVDRAVTLLWLRNCRGGGAVVSETELFDLCKKLGPDRLVDLLRKKPINTDPDLWTKTGYQYLDQSINVVIIRHAKELLRPKDADALIAYGMVKGSAPLAAWFIAAANLQPERAGAILDRGWKMAQGEGWFQDERWYGARMRLTVERWRLVPEEGTALVVKRFYEEPPQYVRSSPHALFLQEFGEKWTPRDRKLLVDLVRDKRFAMLDWRALVTLARLVNRVEKKVVIAPEELKKASHPLGLDNFEWPRLEAEIKYPKETAELKRRMETWRGLLRKALLDP